MFAGFADRFYFHAPSLLYSKSRIHALVAVFVLDLDLVLGILVFIEIRFLCLFMGLAIGVLFLVLVFVLNFLLDFKFNFNLFVWSTVPSYTVKYAATKPHFQ